MSHETSGQFTVDPYSDKTPNDFSNDFIRTLGFSLLLLSNAEEGSWSTYSFSSI